MSTLLDITLEAADGDRQRQRVERVAVRLGDRDLWLEADGTGGLNLFADSQEGERETPVLVIRPQALNALGLSIALETFGDEDESTDHVHGADCGCGHDH